MHGDKWVVKADIFLQSVSNVSVSMDFVKFGNQGGVAVIQIVFLLFENFLQASPSIEYSWEEQTL